MVRRSHRARCPQARRGGRHPRTDDARPMGAISASFTAGARNGCSRCCSLATRSGDVAGAARRASRQLSRSRATDLRAARFIGSPLALYGLATLARCCGSCPSATRIRRSSRRSAVLVDHLDDARHRAGALRAVRARDPRRARLRPRSQRSAPRQARSDDLVFVSPKSGRAVSAAAGEPYKERLLALPGFLIGQSHRQQADRDDISGRLRAYGFFPRPARLRAARREGSRRSGPALSRSRQSGTGKYAVMAGFVPAIHAFELGMDAHVSGTFFPLAVEAIRSLRNSAHGQAGQPAVRATASRRST